MVSFGTILGVIFAGAVAVGGYALYSNRDKLGGAVSRGVETNITNPLGNYFDSLWKGIDAVGSTAKAIDTTIKKTTTSIRTQPPPLTPTDKTQQQVITSQPSLIPVKTTTTRTPAYRPSTVYKPGYYYFNFAGSKYDYQQQLTATQAKTYSQEALRDSEDIFQNIKFLGTSKLGPAGLNLFAKSQNYL